MIKALLFLFFVPSVAGFMSCNRFQRASKLLNVAQSKGVPFEPIDELDVERARDCAAHFGKCSVPELEKLRDGLHKERVEHFLLDSIEAPNHFQPDTEIDHRLLEEDLSVQLSLLNDKMPKSSMFPGVHADGMLSPLERKKEPTKNNPSLAFLNGNTMMLEESVDEAVVVCAAVLLVILFPYILQH